MSLFRRFIIKNWLLTFSKAFIALLLLVTIVNLVSGLLRENVTALEVFLNHLIEIPVYLEQILPISCLGASLFTINRLKDRNELTAIFSSGFSRRNFLTTLILSSSIVAILLFLSSAYLGPFLKFHRETILPGGESKFRNLNKKGLRSRSIDTNQVWYKRSNYFFSFSTFDKENKTLHNFTYLQFNKDHKLELKISSPQLSLFKEGPPMAQNAILINELSKKGTPIIETYQNYPVPIEETIEEFDKIESDVTTLTFPQLYNFIKQIKNSGINANEYLIIFYQKFSIPIICILFTLISSTGIFSPNRRGSKVGKDVFFIFSFSLGYWLVHSYMIELGLQSKTPAFMAAFTTSFIFVFFLIYIFYTNRKLS